MIRGNWCYNILKLKKIYGMKLKNIKKENSKVNKEIESLIEIANIRYILPVASWELKKD